MITAILVDISTPGGIYTKDLHQESSLAHAVSDVVIPQLSDECEYFQMSKAPPERATLSLIRLRPCDVASIFGALKNNF